MQKAHWAVMLLTAVSVMSQDATAQIAPQTAPAQPAAAAPAPQTLDLATAKRMVAAAEAAAVAANAHVGIYVLDSNGDVVASERMDTATQRAVQSSHGKARASLLFGLPTTQIQQAMRDSKYVTATLTPPLAGNWEIVLVQGGLPILKTGKLIGAIGVGGSTSVNDEKFAQAGIDALITSQ